MSYRLLVNPATPQAWAIELKPGVNRIGRGEDNDFTISHGSVSTHHCEIRVADADIELSDLGSTNGTFVDRLAVKQAQLRAGQHIQLGSVDMVLESSSTTPPPPAPIGAARIHRSPAPAPPPPIVPPQAASTVARLTTESTAAEPQRNFWLSLLGVFLGAAIGMGAWHLLARLTGWSLGIMALATGCLAGAAPQVIGHYRSKLMGVIAAVITLATIFATQYFNARVEVASFAAETKELADEEYQERLKYAKRVVAAVPDETDAAIRKFLAAEQSVEGAQITPESIEPEEIQDFKTELPALRKLAAGQQSKEEYRQEQGDDGESGFMRFYLIIRTLGIFNIINVVLGTGAAYLTAMGETRSRR